jgi:hypothetical protein
VAITVCPSRENFSHEIQFGGSFGMSLEGDCHEVEATPNLKLLVTFGLSLDRVCHELYINIITNSYLKEGNYLTRHNYSKIYLAAIYSMTF